MSSPPPARPSRRPGSPGATYSFAGLLTERWAELCTAVRIPAAVVARSCAELLDMIGEPPVDFTVSWRDGRVEVQIRFAPPGPRTGPYYTPHASRELLRARPGADVSPYLSIEDLLVGSDPERGGPGTRYSLRLGQDGRARYRVHLDLRPVGAEAIRIVGVAMDRLGLGPAWRSVAGTAAGLAVTGHRIEALALDLGRGPRSRVDVLFRHPARARTADLDAVARMARLHEPTRVRRFCRACLGPTGPVDEPTTCLTFGAGATAPDEARVLLRPRSVTRSAPVMDLLKAEGVDLGHYLAIHRRRPPGEMRHEVLSVRTTPGRGSDIGLSLRLPQFAA